MKMYSVMNGNNVVFETDNLDTARLAIRYSKTGYIKFTEKGIQNEIENGNVAGKPSRTKP